jgi:hypothetical protein
LAEREIKAVRLRVTDPHARTVLVSGGGFEGELPIFPSEPEHFAFQDPPSSGHPSVSVTPQFWAELERLAFTMGRNALRPFFRGVYWGPDLLMSCDGIRLSALTPGPGMPKPPEPEGLLVPDHLWAGLGDRRGEVERVILDGGLLWCFLPGAIVYASMFEEKFPAAKAAEWLAAVRAKTKKKGGTWVQLEEDAASLPVRLECLLYFTNKDAAPLTVRVENDRVTMTAAQQEGAASVVRDTLPAAVKGPGGEVTVNGRLFQEAVMRVGASFWWGGPGTSLYFRSPDRRLEHLLTPLVGGHGSG